MKKVLLVLGSIIGVIGLLVGGAYISLSRTSLPLYAAAWFLKKQNIEMKDFSGNLTTGFSIGSIQSQDPKKPMELHQLKLSCAASMVTSAAGVEQRVCDEISVDGYVLDLGFLAESKGSSPVAGGAPHVGPGKPGIDMATLKKKWSGSVLVKKISFKNGVIKIPGRPDLKLDQISYENLEYSIDGASLASGMILSPDFEIKVVNAAVTEHFTKVADAELVLKQGWVKKLKKDLVARIHQFAYSDKTKLFSGTLLAFDDKLKVEMAPQGSVALQVQSLDLLSFFNLKSDLQSFSLMLNAKDLPALLGGGYTLQGTAGAFGESFTINKGESKSIMPKLVAAMDQHQIQFSFDFTQALMTTFAGLMAEGDGAMVVPVGVQSNNFRLVSDQDRLAWYSFQKPFNRLRGPQKDKVTSLMQKFHLGAFAVAQQAPPQGSQAARAPAQKK